MWKETNKGVMASILAPFYIIGVLMIVASTWGWDPLKMLKSGTENVTIFWMGIFIILFPTFLILLIFYLVYRHNSRIEYLFNNGIRGTAVLKDLEPTGVHINNVPQYKLFLEIQLPTRPVYNLKYKTCINYLALNNMKKGMEIEVYSNPDNHKDIYAVLPE